MNILLTGGTGFIGSNLCRLLIEQGHDVLVLSRRPDRVPLICGDSAKGVSGLDKIETPVEAVINLAGAPIIGLPWTRSRKANIWGSRVQLTGQLVDLMQKKQICPQVFISGSAIGFYGDGGEKVLTEASNGHACFSQQLCLAWEQQAIRAEQLGIRVCLLRTAVVLGAGGLLARMKPLFKLGLGSAFGSGKQWFSWIQLNDMLAAILFLLNHQTLSGPFNMSSCHPVRQAEFSDTLARNLRRPRPFRAPEWLIRCLAGEMSEVFISGQKVLPQRLQEAGFEFSYSHLDNALQVSL